MALRNIRKDEDTALYKNCRPYTEFNERLWELLDDMGETMMEAEGVGLAAPQVGIIRRNSRHRPYSRRITVDTPISIHRNRRDRRRKKAQTGSPSWRSSALSA